jgi:Tol biopolymer transport system component
VNAGRNELRLFDLSTGADSLLVDSSHEWGVTTDWSKAANVILFSALVEGRGLDCRYVTLTGKRKMVDYLATPANEGAGAISPDGKWIAYWTDSAGTLDLVVDSFPVASGSRRISSGTLTTGQALWSASVWWSDQGRSLIYWRVDSSSLNILDVRTEPALELSNPRPLMRAPDDVYSMTWDRQNKRFLMSLPVGTPRPSLLVIQNWQRLIAEAN